MDNHQSNPVQAGSGADIAMHAIVEGRVQGVGFRFFVVRNAEALGIVGWVRNTSQGHVEVWAEGQKAVLQNLLTILHKGPPSACVTSVDVEWKPANGNLKHFSVRGLF